VLGHLPITFGSHRYGNECDAFLDRIIIGDETWSIIASKWQGMEWKI
jgi:hypothetical protein